MTSPLPKVQVLVAFQNNPCDDPALITSVASPGVLGAANVWTDISAYVSSYSADRGRQHELQQFEAGTCDFELNNVDGRFSSWNTSGPYFGFLLPRKLVQVRVTWSAVVYKRFTGHVDAWPTIWADQLSNFAELHATDAFRIFNLADITTGGYPAQVITDGASAYWRLGDVVGSTTAADSAGTHPGTVMGGTVTFGGPGALLANPGTSALFTSATDIIQTRTQASGNGIASGAAGASFELWFNSTSTDNLSFAGLQMTWLIGATTVGATIQIATGPSEISFVSNMVSGGTAAVFPGSSVFDGAWHHLVIVVTYTTNIIIYLDGVSVSTTAWASPTGVAATPTSVYSTFSSPGFAMQEVAIYPSALSSGQVANHFNLATFPQEGTGARIGRVLNTINWSAGARAIDTGYSTVQKSTDSLTTTSTLSHMQAVECTEGGALYMSGSGQVVFLSRQTLFGNALYTSSQQTIGDNTAGGDMPFQPSPVLALDDIDIYNEAAATRSNGLTQVTDNNASILAYGRVTWQPPAILLGISDSEVLYLTQYVVNKYATPIERLQSVTVDLLELITPNLVANLLSLDLLYQVTVERTVVPGGGTAFSQVAVIEHISETVTPDSWTVELALAVADPAWWILGTSQLGVNTRLAF